MVIALFSSLIFQSLPNDQTPVATICQSAGRVYTIHQSGRVFDAAKGEQKLGSPLQWNNLNPLVDINCNVVCKTNTSRYVWSLAQRKRANSDITAMTQSDNGIAWLLKNSCLRDLKGNLYHENIPTGYSRFEANHTIAIFWSNKSPQCYVFDKQWQKIRFQQISRAWCYNQTITIYSFDKKLISIMQNGRIIAKQSIRSSMEEPIFATYCRESHQIITVTQSGAYSFRNGSSHKLYASGSSLTSSSRAGEDLLLGERDGRLITIRLH